MCALLVSQEVVVHICLQLNGRRRQVRTQPRRWLELGEAGATNHSKLSLAKWEELNKPHIAPLGADPAGRQELRPGLGVRVRIS